MSERGSAEVPLPALERLSTYIRCLMALEREGVESVSSQDMETHTGVTAAQFRKDLSYFGEFGKRGIGYNVHDLRERISELLRINQEQNVLLVGAGHLGSALIAYPGWKSYHFKIAAVFDKDPDKVGRSIRRVPVRSIDDLEAAVKEFDAHIGILAIPAWEAQEVADRMVAAGITGIINFAPVKLQLPPHVIEREVCFICELAILSHLIHNPPPESGNGKHPGKNGRGTRRPKPAG
jgi:redox-sensing transcriptional repressor